MPLIRISRRTSSLRTVFSRVVERLRMAREHRRQRRELFEYLASDHRAANDLGIARLIGSFPCLATHRPKQALHSRNVCDEATSLWHGTDSTG
jgi:hypothetical protein